MEMSTFGERLKIAFGNAKNAEIARKLGVSEAAAGNYVAGRVPDAEKLLKIKSLTNCSLDWLLTGAEDRPAFMAQSEDLLVRRIREIVREEIGAGQAAQELGTVDAFDVAGAVEKYDNAATVLELWYTYDHLPTPEISALPFSGWGKMTLEQKVKEIQAARRMIDEDREFQERRRNAPKNIKHS